MTYSNLRPNSGTRIHVFSVANVAVVDNCYVQDDDDNDAVVFVFVSER